MYWYRSKLKVAVALAGAMMLSFCFPACKPDIKETNYFDIKGYFTADAAKLHRLNPFVQKTVIHNGISESKKVKIDDWGRELDLFIGSDINKPALKNSYTVVDDSNFLIYKAKYPELKMREMIIKKDRGKVKWILIYNKTPPNKFLGLKIPSLYQTTEKLTYFPDSLYLIEKVQKVRLMGFNHYKIQGVISH
jgi:hypothetical protein